MLAVYSGEVRGEVGTRPRMCYVGWVVWVHGVLLIYVMSRYHVMEIMCTYTLNLKYTVCNLIWNIVTKVTVVTLIWYYIKILVSIVIVGSTSNQPVNIFTLIIHQTGFIIQSLNC